MNSRAFLSSRSPQPAEPTAAPSFASATAPAHARQSAAPAGSVISEGLVIVGNVESTGALTVDGVIKGDIDCEQLTVSATGQVEGDILANSVSVYGHVTGTVRGRSVMLYATAKVDADIKHQGIGIEMGTRYDGALRWVEDAELERGAR